jgi:hypothetical protein
LFKKHRPTFSRVFLNFYFSKNKTNIENWYELHDEKYLKRYKENDKKGRYFWDTFARPGLKSPVRYHHTAQK